MANVWPTIKDAGQWISMDACEVLKSKRAVSQFFNTDYSKEFKLKYPVGNSILIPFPNEYGIRNGLEYNPKAKEQRYATVSIGEPFGIDLPEVDSLEAAISSPRTRAKFSQDIIEPAMTRLISEIDSRCALYAYQHAAGVTGILGADPTDFDSTSGAAKEYMDTHLSPDGERGMLLPSRAMRKIRANHATSFNPAADITKMIRTGMVGSTVDGFDWYVSQALYRHTAGTWAGAVTVTTTSVNGATTLALTCTTGDTFNVGDKFSVAGTLPVNRETKRTFGTDAFTFTCLGDGAGNAVTGVGSAATITISPAVYGPTSVFQNVDVLPTAGAALTLWPGTTSPSGKVGNLGLALPKNAFALVGLELEDFTDVETCKGSRDPDSGMYIRFMAAGDARSSKKIRRLDTCLGFGELYNEHAMVIACG